MHAQSINRFCPQPTLSPADSHRGPSGRPSGENQTTEPVRDGVDRPSVSTGRIVGAAVLGTLGLAAGVLGGANTAGIIATVAEHNYYSTWNDYPAGTGLLLSAPWLALMGAGAGACLGASKLLSS